MKDKKIHRIVRYEITRNGVTLLFIRTTNDYFSFSVKDDIQTSLWVISKMNLGTNAIPEEKIDYYAREIHHWIRTMEYEKCSHCKGTGVNPEPPVNIGIVVMRPDLHDPNCCPVCNGEQIIKANKK